MVWQGRLASNQQPADSESVALPIELHPNKILRPDVHRQIQPAPHRLEHNLARVAGIEPTTFGFKIRRSTIELHPNWTFGPDFHRRPPVLRTGASDHSATERKNLVPTVTIRTDARPLTRRVLCQLSYAGMVVMGGYDPPTIRL